MIIKIVMVIMVVILVMSNEKSISNIYLIIPAMVGNLSKITVVTRA